jgi:hypothetical protein
VLGEGPQVRADLAADEVEQVAAPAPVDDAALGLPGGRWRGSPRRHATRISTFVTGDRYGSIVDPFGQRWSVMTRVEDVSKEEADRRLAEWAAENL